MTATTHICRYQPLSEIVLSGEHEGLIVGWPISYRATPERFVDYVTHRPMQERWEAGSAELFLPLNFSVEHDLVKTQLGPDVLTVEHHVSRGVQTKLNARRLSSGDELWAAVRGRQLTGWSVEYDIPPGGLRMDGNVRVIQRGIITGISLVQKPAFDYAQAVARAQGEDRQLIRRRYL